MIRATALPCPRCKASPHRRERRGFDDSQPNGLWHPQWHCVDCHKYYPDWTEAEARAAVLAALRSHPLVGDIGIEDASDDRGRRQYRVGRLDLVGYLKDGRYLAIEVKAQASYTNAKQRQRTERQMKRIENARACGCVAFVAWGPWDVEEQLGCA